MKTPKRKRYDINDWQAVRWLTVCDCYCLTQGRQVWTADFIADFIAQLPKLKKLPTK